MQTAPRSVRYAITLVGRTNAGKSALINAICEQEIAIVSDIAGTTTDTVSKAYELTGFGPVMFYDTAGLEDHSELGEQRIKATIDTLKNSDMALVIIGDSKPAPEDEGIIAKIQSLRIPYLVVYNKCDLHPDAPGFKVSAKKKINIAELKEKILKTIPKTEEKRLLDGLIKEGDRVLLVMPIDGAAPKGRLILPQVQVLREVLDAEAVAVSVQPGQLKAALVSEPRFVITDSQAVAEVAKMLPKNVPLTTFSILFGRLKGDYKLFIEGAQDIDKLKDGDRVLIAEACSHTTVEDDIARDKLPKLLTKYTGKKLKFEFSQGKHFPDDLKHFKLVLHCGSCMLTVKETQNRVAICEEMDVPITNYGMAFAKCNGLLERVTEVFRK